MFGAISKKFRTLDLQINFAIPPISHFRRWLGEFFFPLSKSLNSYYAINQFIRKVKNFFSAFHDSPYPKIRYHLKTPFTGKESTVLAELLQNDWLLSVKTGLCRLNWWLHQVRTVIFHQAYPKISDCDALLVPKYLSTLLLPYIENHLFDQTWQILVKMA